MTLDHKTVCYLTNIVDATWESLPVERRRKTTKSHLAERILKLAARGERDRDRLRACALKEPESAS